jgi:LmbE family N-acetylglucosaminyl deacetylase
MKAVCMVAHPDDCVIFAYSFMHHFRSMQWTVAYLTYEVTDARAREFDAFWQRRGVDTRFLGFPDDYRDIEAGRPSFDTNQARDAIHDAVLGANVILTHDAEGDYGHPHHIFVNRCVQLLCHDHVITFAPPGAGTHHYAIEHPDYDADQLPLHHDVIKSFHRDQHSNSYAMSATTFHRIQYA